MEFVILLFLVYISSVFIPFYIQEFKNFLFKYNISNNKKIRSTSFISIAPNVMLKHESGVIGVFVLIPTIIALLVHVFLYFIYHIIFFIPFQIIKIFDYLYIKNRKVICNHCNEKYDYPPIFRCKNCGVLHKDLKPDLRFGILNHKCECGEKLPVFLGNRNKLEAICKNCKMPVPKELLNYSKQIVIPIIGVNNSDKTKLLSIFLKNIKFKYIFKSDEKKFGNLENISSINFYLLNLNIKNKLVYFFNPDGKNHENIDDMLKEKFYNYANSYIIVFNIKKNQTTAINLLTRFVEVLEHKKELKYNKKYEKPILFTFITDNSSNEQIDTDKLKELNQHNLLNLIETNFSNFQFLILSKDIDTNSEKLIWFCKQANKGVLWKRY